MPSTAQEITACHDHGMALRQAMQTIIETGELDLPMLPQVAHQILASVRNDDSDALDLARLIQRDQSLAAHLLQVANSPAYLGSHRIVSLQQAIARLGLHTISDITLAMVVKAKLFDVHGHEAMLDQLWRHALASAAWAREIARALRFNVESAFLCGLLHEVGKPACLQTLVELERARQESCPAPMLYELMDEFHVEVGSRLATAWSLPGPVAESVAHYLTPTEARSFARDAMIVHCAHAFANEIVEADDFDEDALRTLPMLSELNLYPDDVAALLGKIDVVNETIEALR